MAEDLLSSLRRATNRLLQGAPMPTPVPVRAQPTPLPGKPPLVGPAPRTPAELFQDIPVRGLTPEAQSELDSWLRRLSQQAFDTMDATPLVDTGQLLVDMPLGEGFWTRLLRQATTANDDLLLARSLGGELTPELRDEIVTDLFRRMHHQIMQQQAAGVGAGPERGGGFSLADGAAWTPAFLSPRPPPLPPSFSLTPPPTRTPAPPLLPGVTGPQPGAVAEGGPVLPNLPPMSAAPAPVPTPGALPFSPPPTRLPPGAGPPPPGMAAGATLAAEEIAQARAREDGGGAGVPEPGPVRGLIQQGGWRAWPTTYSAQAGIPPRTDSRGQPLPETRIYMAQQGDEQPFVLAREIDDGQGNIRMSVTGVDPFNPAQMEAALTLGASLGVPASELMALRQAQAMFPLQVGQALANIAHTEAETAQSRAYADVLQGNASVDQALKRVQTAREVETTKLVQLQVEAARFAATLQPLARATQELNLAKLKMDLDYEQRRRPLEVANLEEQIAAARAQRAERLRQQAQEAADAGFTAQALAGPARSVGPLAGNAQLYQQLADAAGVAANDPAAQMAWTLAQDLLRQAHAPPSLAESTPSVQSYLDRVQDEYARGQ